MPSIDDVFKALAEPTRRELLDRLYAENGQTLSALITGLGMTRQAVTQHLQLLESANLVSVQWRGREKLHFFNPIPIHEIYQRWIRKYEQSRLDVLHHLKNTLEGSSHESASTHLRDLHREQR
jgi:DNA-binding transcriptional ArsR family regulator